MRGIIRIARVGLIRISVRCWEEGVGCVLGERWMVRTRFCIMILLLSAFASLSGLCSFCCTLSALVFLLRVIMIIVATHHSVTRASDYGYLETPFT